MSARATPPTVIRPGVGIEEPQQQPRDGRLAGARRARRSPSAGRPARTRSTSRERGFGPARVGDGDAVRRRCRPSEREGVVASRRRAAEARAARSGRVQDLEDPGRGLATRGALVVGGGEPPQRHEELGRDDQHRERRLEPDAAAPSGAGSARRRSAPSRPRRRTRARGSPGTRSAAPPSSRRRSAGRSRGSGPPAPGSARSARSVSRPRSMSPK